MSAQSRLVLGTLCVFNGATLVALAVLAFFFVDGTSGKIASAGFWFTAGCLFGLARRLRASDGWRWPTA